MKTLNSPIASAGSIQHSSRFNLINLFRRDSEHNEGVPLINIYLLKLLFTLMFFFLSFDAWQYIFSHTGPWNDNVAAAYCMWGAYGIMSFIGIRRPLKMLPVILFEVIYKVAWLIIVAYPLYHANKLAGSPVDAMSRVFIWVIIPIVAMPWRYFFRTYIVAKRGA